jgi:hypothetical protein
MNIYIASEFDYEYSYTIGVFSSREKAVEAIEKFIKTREWDSDVQYMSYGIASGKLDKCATSYDEWSVEAIYEDNDGNGYPELRGKVGDKDDWINKMEIEE